MLAVTLLTRRKAVERVEGTAREIAIPKDWDDQKLQESWVDNDSEDLGEEYFAEKQSG
jgi:hypothetical protein